MSLHRRIGVFAAAAMATLAASAAGAQLLGQLPDPAGVIGGVGRLPGEVINQTTRAIGSVTASARELARSRNEALRDLVDAHPDLLELTDQGPAVRGEIIAVDPTPEALEAARRAGYVVTAEERIDGLDLRSVTLALPPGITLRRALGELRRISPAGEFTANHLHLRSGANGGAGPRTKAARLAQSDDPAALTIGIIDGGVADHAVLQSAIEQRGFARGAPAPSEHGTAVASLIAGRGEIRGAEPGAQLLVADVYGRDPAGGNSLAIARALGWMVQRRVPVVAMSLVGPNNALVQRAIAQARARGLLIVAAVGNNGPAAAPAYPASYPGVIAVTGVDGRNRPLIEAGRSLHLDYAAPGGDMAAARAAGGTMAVRGTSFAVPFVAARMARALAAGAEPIAALDSEAIDLAPRGADARTGRGLVCGRCRTPIPASGAGRD